MKLADFKGIFKKNQISFVSKKNISLDYYEFNFAVPNNLTWIPGDHGLFTITDKEISGKKLRPFTVASVPSEGVIKVITRIGDNPSAFKARLKELQDNETIALRGPFGWFKLQDQTTPVVFVAGGVGITPVRALFQALGEDNKRPVTLLYSSKDQFLFQEEFDGISSQDSNITIHYLSNREELSSHLTQAIQQYTSNAYYYISGAPKMNTELKKLLKKNNIPNKRIIGDPFHGVTT